MTVTRVRHSKMTWAATEDVAPLLAAPHTQPMLPVVKRRRCSMLWLCIGLILLGALLLFVYIAYTSPKFNQNNLLRAYQQRRLYTQTKSATGGFNAPRTMLFWNSFFSAKRWGLDADTYGPHEFRELLKCPVYQCELTNQHDFLPDITMYDAVLFHVAESFPLIEPVPSERAPHQLYVFALMEPPGETKHVLSDEGGFYNLTMTYRLDSDLLWPYQTIEDIETGGMVAPAATPNWRTPPSEWHEPAVYQLWPNKTRSAAWFVSHCETLSKREQLAAALQQHIDVDIYGKCGNLSCAYKDEECNNLLNERYKFYFAFENSLCNDYVTEKLYNAMKQYIIPVVFGGANYTRFVPPRSVINVEDFESVAELAEYLKYLASNREEYMRYFWWRRYYRLSYVSPYCELCAKLHSVTTAHRTQIYTDIESYWLADQCRFDATIKY